MIRLDQLPLFQDIAQQMPQEIVTKLEKGGSFEKAHFLY